MLLVFSALALVPMIFSFPRDHASWGANAYNLTAVGAAWIIAEWLADQHQLVKMDKAQSQWSRLWRRTANGVRLQFSGCIALNPETALACCPTRWSEL